MAARSRSQEVAERRRSASSSVSMPVAERRVAMAAVRSAAVGGICTIAEQTDWKGEREAETY